MYEPSGQDALCLLYARDSGDIHFVHRVTTIGDLTPLTDEELESQAREEMSSAAQFLGRETPPDVAAVMVSPEALQPGRRYKVREGRLADAD